MRSKYMLLPLLFSLALILMHSNDTGAEVTCKGQTLSVRFPAFSLSPGEKVSGITVKTSQGKLSNSCLPSRWTCDRKSDSIHCYSMHKDYATAMTGRLPELFVLNLPDDGRQLSLEASVEYVDSDGRAYTKEFSGADLIVK